MPLPLDIVTEVDDRGSIPKKYRSWLREHLQLYSGDEVRIRIAEASR